MNPFGATLNPQEPVTCGFEFLAQEDAEAASEPGFHAQITSSGGIVLMPERQESGKTSQYRGGPNTMSNYQQNPNRPIVPPFPEGGHPPIPPKKKHTVRNILIGVFVGIFVVMGGCTAILGGALSSVDTSDKPATAASTPVDNGPTPDPVTTPTNKPSAAKTTAPSVKPKATQPAMTASQEQAVGAAESYLAYQAFSRKGLIQQLSSDYGEGFSKADATFAVDHIKVNWNEQAARSAKSYLSMQHFSRKGLIQQLESSYGEGFTHAQAVYGVTKAGL